MPLVMIAVLRALSVETGRVLLLAQLSGSVASLTASTCMLSIIVIACAAMHAASQSCAYCEPTRPDCESVPAACAQSCTTCCPSILPQLGADNMAQLRKPGRGGLRRGRASGGMPAVWAPPGGFGRPGAPGPGVGTIEEEDEDDGAPVKTLTCLFILYLW